MRTIPPWAERSRSTRVRMQRHPKSDIGQHENLSTEVSESSATVVERLKASLEAASAHNPSDAEKPVAVLWTDRDSQWRPILARLRVLMPQLLTLGAVRTRGSDRTINLAAVRGRSSVGTTGARRRHDTRALPARRESAGTRLSGSLSERPEAAGGASVPRYVLDAEERPGLDGGGVHGLQQWRPWSGRGSGRGNSAVHAERSSLSSRPRRFGCSKAGVSKQTISMRLVLR